MNPGDKIVTNCDTVSAMGVPIPKGTEGVVVRGVDVNSKVGVRFPPLGNGSRMVPSAHLDLVPVSPLGPEEEPFGGYIDPAAVKAGDTVTLEKGTAQHTDLVADVDRYQDGDYRFKSATSPTHVYRVGDDAWTLTAHQPAPEPEPVDALADTVHHVLALPNYESSHATAHVVEKIRERFVVIDPAWARKALEDNGWGEHEMADILLHLGIEQ